MSNKKLEFGENDMRFAYTLIVEWDGIQAPTSWYNRLHSYGLYVRGSKDASPLARRMTHTKKGWGVIATEGIILVETENLLQQLIMWAEKYKATTILTGRFIIEAANLDDADHAAMESMVKKWAKSGPKRAAELGDYVITCRDEVRTFIRPLDSTPLICPDCLSSRIDARMGTIATFMSVSHRTPDVSVYDYWLATRFSHGMFEIPASIDEYHAGEIVPPSPKDVLRKIKIPTLIGCDDFVKTDEDRLHVYDIAYSLSTMNKKQRIDGRLRVLLAYNIANGKNMYSMAIRPNGDLDKVDLCVLDGSLTKYL